MLKNIKLYFKNNYLSIIIFIGIFIVVSSVILCRPLNNLDEIWNFNFAKNIADGLIPYKDFNMLQTPLLPFIAGTFLKLFGTELIIMRILACFLISSILFIIYKIFNKLNINLFYTLICLFFIIILFSEYICFDYNFAVSLITLILIYLEINYFIKSKNYFNNYYLFYFLIRYFIRTNNFIKTIYWIVYLFGRNFLSYFIY